MPLRHYNQRSTKKLGEKRRRGAKIRDSQSMAAALTSQDAQRKRVGLGVVGGTHRFGAACGWPSTVLARGFTAADDFNSGAWLGACIELRADDILVSVFVAVACASIPGNVLPPSPCSPPCNGNEMLGGVIKILFHSSALSAAPSTALARPPSPKMFRQSLVPGG